MLVHQLMTVGRDVRSTPMQWAYEGKKLDCVAKHMSFRPVWVRPESGNIEDDPRSKYLMGNSHVEDQLGLGRIPAVWWTLNAPYNHAYDIHRLNVWQAEQVAVALDAKDDEHRHVRFDFIRDRPAIATSQIALRTELNMRVVMPAVLPNSRAQGFLGVARFECGAGGNPHLHGLSYGSDNPRLGRVRDELVAEAGEEARENLYGSDDEQLLGSVFARGSDAVRDGTAGQEILAPDTVGDQGSVVQESSEGIPVLADSPVRSGVKAKDFSSLNLDHDKACAPVEEHDLDAKTREFGTYFRRIVSEWNPCFTEDGRQRVSFFWDDDMESHDVECCGPEVEEGAVEPSRESLGDLLRAVLKDEAADRSVDLTAIRRFVSKVVMSAGRHDRHAKTGPILGVHPCARGTKECVFCRYGFPHALRTLYEGFLLEKGEREGQWNSRFPRNDSLMCAHEPHCMACNMGNMDWRPVLNLWAVTEYIMKYATKAPAGSRVLSDVLRDSVDEVCKYAQEGEPVDFLRQSLQKFYARTLGERDYTIFEAVHLGLRLPLVFGNFHVVSLNTSGTRRLKTMKQLEQAGPDEPIAWDSKVDHFDNRLALLRRQFKDPAYQAIREEFEKEVAGCSFYEFY